MLKNYFSQQTIACLSDQNKWPFKVEQVCSILIYQINGLLKVKQGNSKLKVKFILIYVIFKGR